MSARDLTLTIDIPNRRLIRDYFSNLEIVPRDMTQGDTLNLKVIGVEPLPIGDPLRPWRYVELPTSIFVGVGDVGAAPTFGTFTLTFGADTTAALPYNATSAQVAVALNALASITAAGGVAVAGPDSGPYQIAFTVLGTRALITGNADVLYPLSSITVYAAREGSATTTEIQVVVIDRQPAALAQTFTVIPPATIAISSIQAGATGVPAIQKIAISPTAHDGTWTLTFSSQTSAAIDWDVLASDLQAAIEALPNVEPGDVEVTGEFPDYFVTFKGLLTGPQPLMTASSIGLISPIGVEGELVLATAGIEQLLGGEASVISTLEVAAFIGGAPATLLQENVTIVNDQIPNAPVSGTNLPLYYTAAEVDALIAGKANSGDVAATLITAGGKGIIGRTAINAGPLAFIAAAPAIVDAATDAPTDANTAVDLNVVFSDTEVETALNALATKLNATATNLNTLATKFNTLLTQLESSMILSP